MVKKLLYILLLTTSLLAQRLSDRPELTIFNPNDIIAAQTDSLSKYVWRQLTLDSLKNWLKDSSRTYILGTNNSWDGTQTFNSATYFNSSALFTNTLTATDSVYLNDKIVLSDSTIILGDMDFAFDSRFILPQRTTNSTLGSMRLVADPEDGSRVVVGFVTSAGNEEYLADRTWINAWKDTADIGIDLTDIKYKPLSVAVTGADSVLQADENISVYELAHLNNVNLNIQTQFNRLQDDTTNWDAAYTKRVDTWNYPLYYNANTASLLYNTTHFTTTSNQLTANQITFASNNGVSGNNVNLGGTLTIDTPQDLRTTASPTFVHPVVTNITANGYINQETSATNTFDGDLETDNYVSQLTGWQISSAGNADFREMYADELYVKAFIADISQALAGSDFVTKSVAILSRDFTTPVTSGTIYVEDLPGQANTAVFATGDWIRLRIINRTTGITVSDFWGTVSSYSDLANGEQSWTLTKQSGTSSQTVYKGSLVLDYGQSGDAVIERTVLGSNAPYGRVATWTTDPSNGANYEVLVQYGNLDGISGLTGDGFYAKDNVYISDVSGGTGIEFLSSTTKSVTTGFSVWNPSNPKLFIGNSNYYLDWNNLSAGVLSMKGVFTITGGSGLANLTDAGDLAVLDGIDASYISDVDPYTTGQDKQSLSTLNYDSPSGAGFYLDATHLGYYTGAAWTTYMDNSGNFYLGGTSGKLRWNAGTNSLYIDGSGTFSGALSAATGTFEGALDAATGTFEGKVVAGSIQIGNDVSPPFDGIYFDTGDYWLSNGNFKAANGQLYYDQYTGGGFTISGDVQVSGTFTGGTYQTSSSGQRVIIDGANNKLTFYSSTGESVSMQGNSSFLDIAGLVQATSLLSSTSIQAGSYLFVDDGIYIDNLAPTLVITGSRDLVNINNATIQGNLSVSGNYGLSISDLPATGTPSSSTYLRGDGTWSTPSGGWSGSATSNLDMNSYNITEIGYLDIGSHQIDSDGTTYAKITSSTTAAGVNFYSSTPTNLGGIRASGGSIGFINGAGSWMFAVEDQDGDNVNIVSGALEMGGTTVIESDRDGLFRTLGVEQFTDSGAPLERIYWSSTAGKLAFRTPDGTPHYFW